MPTPAASAAAKPNYLLIGAVVLAGMAVVAALTQTPAGVSFMAATVEKVCVWKDGCLSCRGPSAYSMISAPGSRV